MKRGTRTLKSIKFRGIPERIPKPPAGYCWGELIEYENGELITILVPLKIGDANE